MFPRNKSRIAELGRCRVGRTISVVASCWAYFILPAALLLAALFPVPAQAAPTFGLHYVANANSTPLPVPMQDINAMNGSLSDLDNDGDLDWTVGNGMGANIGLWWYEYQGPDTWVPHTLSTGQAAIGYSVASFDVNGDGQRDLVSGAMLFLNQGNKTFSAGINIGTSAGNLENHDHTPVDINRDGKLDLLTTNSCGYNGNPVGEIVWYEAQADPTQTWTRHAISTGTAVPSGYIGLHAGTFPNGAGDFNGDGRIDVASACGWYENTNAAATSWTPHWNTGVFLGQVGPPSNGSYETCVRTQVLDLNGDGFLDIVQAEGDTTQNAMIAWLKNDGQGNFSRYVIRSGRKEDYHSLAVADFDNDGDFDVLTGAGPLATGTVNGANPHGVFLFENTAGAGQDPAYTFRDLTKAGNGIISDANAATLAAEFATDHCHEPMFGDVNGDGKVDLILKGWDGHNRPYDSTPKDPASFIFLLNTSVDPAITWTGAANSTWSITAGTGNWKNTGNGAAASYGNALAVTFDDSATGSLTATISAADVSPRSVVFNNSTKDFVVTGAKGIVGTTRILKQGTAKVTLGSVNSYTGVTTVEGGTLQFNKAAAWNPVVNLGGADIKAGMMVFDYTGEGTPAPAIGALLATSFHSGSAAHFDTGKFRSTTADADHGLGWIENMSQQVLVAYTLYGDATVDGSVDISDLSALGQNWNGAGKNWAQGDFNYDGKVDISDLSALGQHWNQSAAGFTGGDSGATVPEPSSCVLLGIGALGLLAQLWRRRQHAA